MCILVLILDTIMIFLLAEIFGILDIEQAHLIRMKGEKNLESLI